MKYQNDRPSGRRREWPARPTLLQSAIRLAQAVREREIWRQHLTPREVKQLDHGGAKGATGSFKAQRPTKHDADHRARFAEQIARSEFGRFYRNDRLDGSQPAAHKPPPVERQGKMSKPKKSGPR